jgi:hypothetical protein
MEVRDQRIHLRLGEAAFKGGHHAFASVEDAGDFLIGGGCATGQVWMLKDRMQVGRDFFEFEIVVLVAVGAAHLVEVFALGLLRSERRLAMAGGDEQERRSACEETGSLPFAIL